MNPNLTVFRGTSVGKFGPHPRIKKSAHTPMEGANIFYLDTRRPFLTLERYAKAHVFVKPVSRAELAPAMPWRENEGEANHH